MVFGSPSVLKDIGRILTALSGMLFLSSIISILVWEPYNIHAFLIPGILVLLLGMFLTTRYSDAPQATKLDSMITAAFGWLLVAVFGSLPFIIIAWTYHFDPALVPSLNNPTIAVFQNPLDAFFESMSGFTGTGLTVTLEENKLPQSLHWWRSFMQWIGGVGVIVLTAAILQRPGSGSYTLYESEARSEKIHPSIVSTARSIWWIVIIYTVASILILFVAGMPIWDSINHGMTGIATGGFSVVDGSIAYYDSALIDFALIPIMIFGAISFPIHYLLLKGDLKAFIKDVQLKWFMLFLVLGSLFTVTILVYFEVYQGNLESARFGIFQLVSASTCTGFQTALDLGKHWPVALQLFISIFMVVGAASGSTAGGIKIIRSVVLIKGIYWKINNVFYPVSAIRQLNIGDRVLKAHEANKELQEASIVAFLWIVFLVIGILIFSLYMPDYSIESIIFEVNSAQGNVGLSTGITGPDLPFVPKVMMILNMWIGRLEIIPVVVFLESIFRLR